MGCPNLPPEYFFSLTRPAHFENPLSGFDLRCQRDPIGNRTTSSSTETGSSVTRNYTSNQLNQYTAIDNPAAAPTYDDDGNTVSCPLSSGNWTMTWDAENRLVVAEKTGQRLEFKYDYAWRRVEKKVIIGEIVSKCERFVYDEAEQIEQLNASDSNTIEKKMIWGAEGKIIADIHPSGTYYALGDANKNITEYLDGSGVVQGHYEFSPFGKITVASGVMPDAFDFRFSSEYFDSETNLAYYNYRYYSPELGRWLSMDPIEEFGGNNLYHYCLNNSIDLIDYYGLIVCNYYILIGHGSETTMSYATFQKIAGPKDKCGMISCKAKPEGKKEHQYKYGTWEYSGDVGVAYDKNKPDETTYVENGGKTPGEKGKGLEQAKRNAAGFIMLVSNNIAAVLKEADETAGNCECGCEEVNVILKSSSAFLAENSADVNEKEKVKTYDAALGKLLVDAKALANGVSGYTSPTASKYKKLTKQIAAEDNKEIVFNNKTGNAIPFPVGIPYTWKFECEKCKKNSAECITGK